MVAVAHNGDVIARDRYDEVSLNDGDSVEVVRMVGGG
jgi:thiamine biosynthesis protein ThiS